MAQRRISPGWIGLTALSLTAASACVVPEFAGDGRDDGGTGGSGTGGTGSSVGGSSGGSGTGGSGTGGTPATLEGPCSQSGDHACDASDGKLTLLCSGGSWQSAGTCSTSEACEPTTGLCADIVESCAEREPGDRFCAGDVVTECGPNLVSEVVIDECEGHCTSTTASASCVPANCGDGYPDAGEDCDDGDADNDDACTELCQAPFCGDGFEQTGETCDDGDADNDDTCTELCEPPMCGDAFVQTGEDCDLGEDTAALGAASCLVDCSRRTVQVVTGAYHTCALHPSGQVKCWGENLGGALGLGDTEPRGDESGEMHADLPTVDLGMGRYAKALQVGYRFSCALLDDDSVKCWGDAGGGALGLGDTEDRGDEPGEMGDNLPPVDLGEGRTAKALASGMYHMCAILDDDSVKCWGSNDYGQLGVGDEDPHGTGPDQMGDDLPTVDLGSGRFAKAIDGGAFYTCAILDDDSVKCWGYAESGQLGLGNTDSHGHAPGTMGDALPTVDLGTGHTAKALAAGSSHVCVVLDDDSVKCWGDNDHGQLGQGDDIQRGDDANEMGDVLLPVDLGSGRSAKALSAGSYHSCALLDDDSVKCWGNNGYGQLGLGNDTYHGDGPSEMGDDLPAVDLGTSRSAKAMSSGNFHTCALLDDDSVKCWGHNTYGQLGIGDPDDRGPNAGEMGDDLPVVEMW